MDFSDLNLERVLRASLANCDSGANVITSTESPSSKDEPSNEVTEAGTVTTLTRNSPWMTEPVIADDDRIAHNAQEISEVFTVFREKCRDVELRFASFSPRNRTSPSCQVYLSPERMLSTTQRNSE
jgi:hypothetical protein